MGTTCSECGAEIETATDVEAETVNEVEIQEGSDGPPRVQLGANKRDLYRCSGCGTILGVN